MDTAAVTDFVSQTQSRLDAAPQMDEQTTKLRIINPLIELLGWNPTTTDVEPEYPLQIATQTYHVDYALQIGDTPAVFLEAKSARRTINQDHVRQLGSYVHNESAVDWGLLTNGRTYVLVSTVGADDWQVIDRFDLDDLEHRPNRITVISRSTIESGKAETLAKQAAAVTEAIEQLEVNTDEIATEIATVLEDTLPDNLPIDITEQTTAFLENLAETLQEQQSSINPEPAQEPAPAPDSDEKDGYGITVRKDGTVTAQISEETQTEAMQATAAHLVDEHNLIEELPSIPYIPGKHRALINDQPQHPDGDEMRQPKELPDGHYLEAHDNKSGKKRSIKQLGNFVDASISFSGLW